MHQPRRRPRLRSSSSVFRSQQRLTLRRPRRIRKPWFHGWRVTAGAITQAATAIAAVGALVFTAVSLKVTQDQNTAQNYLTEQAQVTDRYTKAVDQLGQRGDDRLQIRLGGIYALERLSRDSSRDNHTILDVLAAFLRSSAPDGNNAATNCPGGPLPEDVRAAVTVIARWSPKPQVPETNSPAVGLRRVDLGGTCFQGVNLVAADLKGFEFRGTDFSRADLTQADLSNTNLLTADLTNTHLDSANLSGANLSRAKANGANLRFAKLRAVFMDGADLRDANLRGVELTNSTVAHADLSDAFIAQAQLHKTDMDSTNLTRAILSHANISDARLTFANLSDADLAGANLRSANLSGANLRGADLRGADLTGAIRSVDPIIDGTKTDGTTKGQWW